MLNRISHGPLRSVSLGLDIKKALLPFNKIKKARSVPDVVHNKIDAVGSLVHKLHLNDERIVHLEEDELLKLDILQRVAVNDDVFADALHRIILLVQRQVDEIHLK